METNNNAILVISTETALSNDTLRNIRAEVRAEVDKANKSFSALYAKAGKEREQLFRSIGIKLAALPDKLDPETYDGFKSPLQFAEKGMGIPHSAAHVMVTTGRIYADPNTPEEWRAMPPYNLAELLRADRDAAIKATEAHEITAKSTQEELEAFKKAHPAPTKTGKAKVVTILRDSVTGAEGTEKELVDSITEIGAEALKAKPYDFQPLDAPSKHLTVRVYVALTYDGETGEPVAVVHKMTPKYEPDTPTASDAEKAKAAAEAAVIVRFMAAHPDASRDDAIATLRELGLID